MRLERRAEITFASALDAPPEDVWERVTTEEGINNELWPLMRMTFPKALEDGVRVEDIEIGEKVGRSWILAFGFLPFDYDDLRFERIDPGSGFLERGNLLTQRRWEHERTVRPLGGASVLVDRVSWEPRLPVPGRALRPLFRFIFNHRHRRLRAHFGGRQVVAD